jgi:hypothetical protein
MTRLLDRKVLVGDAQLVGFAAHIGEIAEDRAVREATSPASSILIPSGIVTALKA